jgi:uncharacterized membrane protein
MENKQNSEEFVPNKRRDWIIFGITTVIMIALLIFIPEWVWVIWPFQFTALAGALDRM